MIDSRTRQAIEAALAASDIARAATLAEAALAAGQDDPMLLNLAAWALEERRDFAGAEALLSRALATAPGDVLIVTAIGGLLRKQGRLREALEMLDRAIGIAPDYAVAWLERGYAFDIGSVMKQAAASFARAAELDPGCAPAFAGQASVAARIGQFDRVRALAERALALDPADVVALRAIAAADLDAGALDEAVAGLRALLKRGDLPATERLNALTTLGDALDKQNDPAAAYAAYAESKSAFAALYARDFAAASETHLAFVERLLRSFEAIDPAAWAARPAEPVAGEAARHGVLLGYPRSGTTLAENVLASAPGVSALEELPTSYDADREFLADESGLARLAALGPAEAAPWRAAYWKKVAGFGADAAGKGFVDMDPLKSIKLPLFSRLFPEARIFLMLRDPRDVVLSCFRRNFAANSATYEFTSLESTARHYDATMRLLTRTLDGLPLNVHRVRYADLVADFDVTTQRMCAALGVPWSPSLRDFSRTAKLRGVSTASVAQVGRGLFDGGGQWHRYEAQMAPVLPILEPWLDRLGMAG